MTRIPKPRQLHTEEQLKKHKKGKEYVAKELARQEKMHDYTQLDPTKVPHHLDYHGKEQWKTIVPLLCELPISEHDKNLVETWCILYSQRRQLQKDLQSNGLILSFTDEHGNVKQKKNVAHQMILEVVKEMRAIGSQLGLSVSSRLSMVEPDEKEEEDIFLELLK